MYCPIAFLLHRTPPTAAHIHAHPTCMAPGEGRPRPTTRNAYAASPLLCVPPPPPACSILGLTSVLGTHTWQRRPAAQTAHDWSPDFAKVPWPAASRAHEDRDFAFGTISTQQVVPQHGVHLLRNGVENTISWNRGLWEEVEGESASTCPAVHNGLPTTKMKILCLLLPYVRPPPPTVPPTSE